MISTDKHIRTFLFVPANRPERFAKAEASGADAVILDLEDSVPSHDKAIARTAIVEWMRGNKQPGASIWVRINSLQSAWIGEDLDAVLDANPDGVVLPKCEGSDDVYALDKLLSDAERRRGMAERSIAIIAIATETPRALQKLHTFDHPMPRLYGLLWGAEDLAAALGLRSLRDQTGTYLTPAIGARNGALMASHACQALAIDAVYTGLDDPIALEKETTQHASIGFTAKAAIHPKQIEVIHKALLPAIDDVNWAKKVVAALRDGELASSTVDGLMVDQPHLIAARRILASLP